MAFERWRGKKENVRRFTSSHSSRCPPGCYGAQKQKRRSAAKTSKYYYRMSELWVKNGAKYTLGTSMQYIETRYTLASLSHDVALYLRQTLRDSVNGRIYCLPLHQILLSWRVIEAEVSWNLKSTLILFICAAELSSSRGRKETCVMIVISQQWARKRFPQTISSLLVSLL